MKTITQLAIDQHLISQYPREGCGLLLGNGAYFPCTNSRELKAEEHFRISAEEWAEAEDIAPIAAVVHSHPNWTEKASEGDRVGCEASGLPWYIYSIHLNDEGEVYRSGMSMIEPSGYRSPLVGRPFIHGTLDCLQIILDYYGWERGVDLGAYEREDGWWDNGKDYYRELLPKAGFKKVDGDPEDIELQEGDVVLMQVKSPVPNHAGIFLKRGSLCTQPELHATPGSILHHSYGSDSRRDVYGGYWLKHTVSIWRYHG